MGSFIMGLDADKRGIGQQIADAAHSYGLDLINVLFLTPLPGTRLWDRMKSEGRIAADTFPEDWKFYTLTFPVACYQNLSWSDLFRENEECARSFYSYPRILSRFVRNLVHMHRPLYTLCINIACRHTTLCPKAVVADIRKTHCDERCPGLFVGEKQSSPNNQEAVLART
jgi:hypothetical protein